MLVDPNVRYGRSGFLERDADIACFIILLHLALDAGDEPCRYDGLGTLSGLPVHEHAEVMVALLDEAQRIIPVVEVYDVPR